MSFQSWGYIACLAAMPPPWHNQHKTTFPDQSTTLLTNRAAGLSCPTVINLVFQHWSFSNQTKILLQEDYEKARVARVEVERAWIRARRPGPNFWLALNKSQAQGYTSLISEKAWTKPEPGLIRLHMYKARAWSWLEGYFNRLGLVWARYPEALAKVGLKKVGSFQF